MPEVTLPTSPRFKNLKGMKFGRLTVVEYAGQTAGRKHRWKCLCVCGAESEAATFTLTSGHTKSCGCYRVEVFKGNRTDRDSTTHGESGGKITAEYRTWTLMKRRCYNVNAKEFKDYGGRGISVCDRWRNSYQLFLEDMGRRPIGGYSIDRIDNDAGYNPSNCRWATRTQQNRNTRRNNTISHNGQTLCQAEWLELTGSIPTKAMINE